MTKLEIMTPTIAITEDNQGILSLAERKTYETIVVSLEKTETHTRRFISQTNSDYEMTIKGYVTPEDAAKYVAIGDGGHRTEEVTIGTKVYKKFVVNNGNLLVPFNVREKTITKFANKYPGKGQLDHVLFDTNKLQVLEEFGYYRILLLQVPKVEFWYTNAEGGYPNEVAEVPEGHILIGHLPLFDGLTIPYGG
ncbi:hypothetical protein [Bacillus wiedmannii]|uniref:hypothetical protein n=1 Tax=Bacillus wiedmannii TaxID=1890302 RepID=UPI000BFCC0BB|nr:hypothetical protein [Bacillus wiedmannii]PHE70565.1 hypothetical protein COF77_25465 [Bacillus wiedmannii]